jgi:arylsulfatase A-like enzyme
MQGDMTDNIGSVAGETAGDGSVTRRNILAGAGALAASRLAAAVGAGVLGAGRALAENQRPNILFILADDLGWGDVSYHGSDIRTPNIDKLAETGARLEEFYVQPMCTPTRAAFMSGRYPFRYGLQTGVIPSGGTYGLPTDEYTLAQVMKDAGYSTNLVGKWHIGHADQKYWPQQRGFDYAYGPLIGEIDHFKHTSHGVLDWFRNGQAVEEEGYDTALFGADAVRIINEQDGKSPFFLYLAFTAPHSPYQAPQEYLDRYTNIADAQRRAYAAQITAMDDQVGTVIAALEARGLRENTLVFFVSDNGGTRSKMFVGEAAVEGDLPPSNGAFREGKGTTYEGGTRVVALANCPGRVQAGVVGEMMHIVDMLPTFAALAGGSTEKTKPLDGFNVWETISAGKGSPRHELVYNIEPTGGAIRQDNLKLVWAATLPQSVELFDLDKDPSEANNLAEGNQGKVTEMKARIEALAAESKPPMFLFESLRLALSIPPLLPGAPAPH